MADSIDSLAAEMRGLLADIAEIKHTCKNVAQAQLSQTELLARLDERHKSIEKSGERAHARLDTQDLRVTRIEMEQPVTKLVTRVLISGAVGVLAIVGGQLVATQRIADRPVQVVIDKDVIERLSKTQP